MILLVAFAVISVLTLIMLAFIAGFARHMGNPEPTDWKAILLVSFVIGALGAGVFAVAWEIINLTWGLLS